MVRCLAVLSSLVILLAVSSAISQTSPQGISLQGRIIDSSNNDVEDPIVLFTVQIISPGIEECVLYEETHTINMTGSGGVFALPVGNGSRLGAAFEDTSTLAQVFNNASGQINGLTCTSGNSYTPVNTAKRKIKMTFDVGGGPQIVTQTLDIQAVPYALYADTLQGKGPLDFLQTSVMTTQVKIDNLAANANYNEILALIGGTSANYTLANGGNFTPAVDVDFNGKKIVDLAAPTNATDATNKTYVDTKFGGATLDQTGLADGQSVRWNAGASKWEVYTPSTGQWVTSGSNIYYSTGNVGIGTTTPNKGGLSFVNTTGPVLHIRDTTIGWRPMLNLEGNGTSALQIKSSSNTSNAPAFWGLRSGGTIDVPTAVTNNNLILSIEGYAHDGTDFDNGVASVNFEVDGTSGADDTPGRIVFSTSPDNSNSPIQRVVIKNNGNVGIGTTTPGAKLEVNGQVKITGGAPGTDKVLTSDSAGLSSWQAPPSAVLAGMISTNLGGGITGYGGFSNISLSATETLKQIPLPRAGTLRNLFINTGVVTQPADGNFVITVRKNGVDTALVITIPASSGTGVYSNTTNSVAVAAGDLISIKFVNNASTNSIGLYGISAEYSY